MSGTNELLDVITFCCPACQARLTVPLQLAGIEGPCPSCYHTIRAPERPALASPPPFLPPLIAPPVPEPPPMPAPVAIEREPAHVPQYNAPAWDDTTPIMLPVMVQPETSIPEALVAPAFNPGNFNELMDAGQDKGFKARLAIRPPEELDASWKERHREQEKGRRRVRRVERAAQSFLDSRTFRLGRAALLLLCGGMVAWLTLHLKENHWSFGSQPPVAEGTPARRPGVPLPNTPPAPPAGPAIQGDDDAEIPAASDTTPDRTARPGANIAAPPK